MNARPLPVSCLAALSIWAAACSSSYAQRPVALTGSAPTSDAAPAVVTTVTPGAPNTEPIELLWRLGPFNPADGIGLDPQGNLYAMDSDNHRIEKFDRDGNFLSQWGSAGLGEGQWACVGICMLAVDDGGIVYITDVNSARIQKFDSNGKFLAQWGTYGSGDGQLNNPFGIAVDHDGNVYVGDVGNFRIQKFDKNGRFLLKWGSSGTGEGKFTDDLSDMVVDRQGNVYVGDRKNGVQRFDANGKFVQRLAACGDEPVGYAAAGVTIDTQGALYVSDIQGSRICKYDADGKFLTYWNVPPGIGGIAIDHDGNLYGAERYAGYVLKFRLR
ncbi:MAG TPA: hypothetical protein VFH29_02895 [Anaerolineales bacterium]|nr:hypothetical protein [Anaerolineales bacterium]